MSGKPVNENDDDARPGEGFVARWARLKWQETEADGQPAAAPARTSGPASGPVQGAGGDERGDVTGVDDHPEAPLPSVEDLKPDSDITAFLDKRVPEELRRLAMRRMWTLDPAIRDFIEMAENQYDWNDPNGVPGFGPLPAGTDMEALLAQATGMWKPAAQNQQLDDQQLDDQQPDDQQLADQKPGDQQPDSAAVGAVAAADAPGEGGVTDGDRTDAHHADVDQSGAGATGGGALTGPVEPGQQVSDAVSDLNGLDTLAVAASMAADGPLLPPDDVATPQRRRHGGALPV